MIPNYKRPKYREYIVDVLERPLDDQDLDMIVHIENLENIRLIYNTLKDFINGETFRVDHALHELGNAPRAEYSGLLLGKAELLSVLKWRIKDIESAYDIAKMYNSDLDLDVYNLVALPKSEVERLRNIESSLKGGYNNRLYCPRNIETGEYIDERYNLTDDISEAIGWRTPEDCKKDIATLDEPEMWEVVEKIINMVIVEKVEG